MFRRLTHLLFGGEEEVSEDVQSGEVVDEGWLVVPHQEATSSGNQDLLTANQRSESAPHRDRDTNMDGDSLLAAESSASPGSSTTIRAVSASSSKALTELTQFTCTQKTKPRPVQHPVSRNAIQRQNRVRQGVQRTSFHLHQPSHRSLGH